QRARPGPRLHRCAHRATARARGLARRLSLVVARARHRRERAVSAADRPRHRATTACRDDRRAQPLAERRREETSMFITKKHLSRRTVLRGIGAGLALPLLDSMVPALTALGQTAAASGRLRRLG